MSGQAEEGLVGYRLLPDGEERWSLVRSTPIVSGDGAVEHVINVIHDMTAERQARERAKLVDETGAVFAASIDIDATFDALATLLVPRFADYCIVDMVDDGRLRQVVIAHRDPERAQLLRELRERYPPDANGRIRSRRCWPPASRTSSRTRGRRRWRTPPSTRSTSSSIAAWRRCRTSSCRSRRGAGCWARSRWARASRAGASATSTSPSHASSRGVRRSRSTMRCSSAPHSSRTRS